MSFRMFLRRPSAVSISVIALSLFGCILFLNQLKGVYEANQKFKRLQDYKIYMNDVIQYVNNVENMTNKSSEYYQTLSRLLPPIWCTYERSFGYFVIKLLAKALVVSICWILYYAFYAVILLNSQLNNL